MDILMVGVVTALVGIGFGTALLGGVMLILDIVEKIDERKR